MGPSPTLPKRPYEPSSPILRRGRVGAAIGAPSRVWTGAVRQRSKRPARLTGPPHVGNGETPMPSVAATEATDAPCLAVAARKVPRTAAVLGGKSPPAPQRDVNTAAIASPGPSTETGRACVREPQRSKARMATYTTTIAVNRTTGLLSKALPLAAPRPEPSAQPTPKTLRPYPP